MSDCELCAPPYSDYEWSEHRRQQKPPGIADEWAAKVARIFQDWDMPRPIPDVREIVQPQESVSVRFYRLAAEWSANTGHISSASDLIADRSYREIVKLGWDVVPFLLMDLQTNKRFWFPALYEITNVRPFDAKDAGNARRMADAWIRWGKRKGLI